MRRLRRVLDLRLICLSVRQIEGRLSPLLGHHLATSKALCSGRKVGVGKWLARRCSTKAWGFRLFVRTIFYYTEPDPRFESAVT